MILAHHQTFQSAIQAGLDYKNNPNYEEDFIENVMETIDFLKEREKKRVRILQ